MPQMNNAEACTLETCPLSMATVHYDPSLVANTFFLTLFAGMLLVHAVQTWQFRAWSYSISILSGLILEIVGYVGRIQMHFNPFDPNPFLIYLVCLTIGPVFFSAAIYLTLSRVIVHYGIRYSWLTPKRISIIFMSCDFIALVLQAAGGAIADTASTRTGSDLGTHILVAGLTFQVMSLLFFIGVASHYAIRLLRLRKGKDTRVQGLQRYQTTLLLDPEITQCFNLFLIGLSFATILILIRSTFRVAELWKGFESKLANNEECFIILECSVTALAITMLTFFHAGEVFQREWKNSGWDTEEGNEKGEAVYQMRIQRSGSVQSTLDVQQEVGYWV